MNKLIKLLKKSLGMGGSENRTKKRNEIPGFFLLLKNDIFIPRSEDIIFIFSDVKISISLSLLTSFQCLIADERAKVYRY